MVSILVVSACLLPAAFSLAPDLESLATDTCSLPLRREIHAAQEVLDARAGARGLFQLCVLCLGFLQDGDIGVGFFPEREEVLIGGTSFSEGVLL